MQVLTKKPPTDSAQGGVVMLFEGPLAMRERAIAAMRDMGFTAKSEGRPWREALGVTGEYTPAMYMRGIRYRENLTQKQLFEKTGISVCHISAMENGKRPIGKKNARILAQALNIDPKRLLSV